MLGRQAQRAGKLRVHFDDQHAFRVAAAAREGIDGCTRVQRQTEAAVGIGGRDGGGHHARIQLFDHGGEAAEVARNEMHGVPGRDERALGRAEETAA